MKREVAVRTGNFRRASPTSNRAKCLMEPLFGILRPRAGVNPKKEKRFAAGKKFRLLIRGRGNARQSVPSAKYRLLKKFKQEAAKWQSAKKSESD